MINSIKPGTSTAESVGEDSAMRPCFAPATCPASCARPRSARVALCDLSPELLAQAKLRVDKLGLADRVDLIQCDITAGPAALAKLGLRSKDSAVVTCSYCLTMIPAWRAAVDAMLDLLVDDGALCLIDFTQRFDRASTLVERVYKAWFGLDGCLLYTSPSPRDVEEARMPASA